MGDLSRFTGRRRRWSEAFHDELARSIRHRGYIGTAAGAARSVHAGVNAARQAYRSVMDQFMSEHGDVPAPEKAQKGTQAAPRIRTGGYSPWQVQGTSLLGYKDTNHNQEINNSTPRIYLLNGMSLGNTIDDRRGQQINMTHLHLRYKLRAGHSQPNSMTCRVTVIYDSQTCGSAPTYPDVFGRIGDLGTTHILGHRNLSNIDRFEVIYDKYHAITKSENGSPKAIVNKILPLGLDTRFNEGNAGTIGDIASGSLYLIAHSESPDALGSELNPTIQTECRVQFMP